MDEMRAGRLQALLKHPSWNELVETVDEYHNKYAAYVMTNLMSNGELPDDFEYKRGFLAGMKHVSRYPGVAEKKLERAIAKSKEEGDTVVG
jgi:hypothetical protein